MPVQENDKLIQQQALFSRIASRYDLVNHIMTGWQDNRWRRFAVKKLQLPANPKVLDIGSGNGQIVNEIYRQFPDASCVAADLTLEMMKIGKSRHENGQTTWVSSDAGNLSFQESSFDGVISGFLIRNLADISSGFQSQYRILKSGGRIAVLDTSRPPNHILAPVIRFYMKKAIPIIGGLIAGDRTAYQYLNDSTLGFLRAQEVAEVMKETGFRDVNYRQFAFGMISVHWGRK